MENLPTEILQKIFSSLSVNDLVRYRRVNSRWLCIIDSMFDKDLFWKHRCEVDFADTYELAKKKCHYDLKWANLYRSLKLWGRLSDAEEQLQDFCTATCFAEYLNSARLLPNNELVVHKKTGLTYYDLDRSDRLQRKKLSGNFLKCTETDTIIAMHNAQFMLMLVNKIGNQTLFANEERAPVPVQTFRHVKDYILTDNALYLFCMNNSLEICYYRGNDFEMRSLGILPEARVSMGIKDNELQLLLYDHKIYSVCKGEHKLSFHTFLDRDSNILQKLVDYNLIDAMDWKIYLKWMCEYRIYVDPDSIIHDCVIMHKYGNVVFLGTDWGLFRIYYNPFHNGVLDLNRSQHVIEHFFMDQVVTSTKCPILSIDCQEEIDGHRVIVTVPKRVIILKYKHV